MHCLITGVAGFVGSSLADRLLKSGHTVCGIDCFTDYYPRLNKERNLESALKQKGFTFHEENLISANLVERLRGVDWVFHQAAQAGVRRSWGSYFETYTTNNVHATQRILEAVKNVGTVKKFVYASSSSIYGDAESYPTPEKLTPRPVSPYGVTKLAAEHLASLYATEFGLPTVSLRYFTVYGPRQRPDMGFYRFISRALMKEEIQLFGDGEQSRDFTYIDDIVTANILAAERGPKGAIYNIGGGTQATINSLLQIIEKNVGPLRIRREERQAGDARHTSADTSLARTQLGYNPTVSLAEGIAREVEWLKSCQAAGLIAKI